jgi:hypothetical protein
MALGEMGRGVGDWFQLIQDRDRGGSCECGDEPAGSGAAYLVQINCLKDHVFVTVGDAGLHRSATTLCNPISQSHCKSNYSCSVISELGKFWIQIL